MQITDRQIHSVPQGSAAWLQLRAGYPTASEAPAAASVSKYTSRSDLLKQKATGIVPEVSRHQQAIFDRGHAAEAAARPIAEGIVGGELFPVTMTAIVDGIPMLASMDGLLMDETVSWENKLWNEELAEAVRQNALPEHYTVQMDQQLAVSGAERCLFTCSDGTEERTVYCWYTTTPEKIAKLVGTWRQFDKDVAAYIPPKAEPVAAKIQAALPALRIEATGEITASNLDEFQVVVLDRINSVNMELVTDQDFADGAADAEWLRDVSKKMKKAVEHVRGGMQSVDEVLRVLERLDEIATQKAIAIEKKVKTEKDVRKEQIVMKAENDLAAHITGLNEKLGASYIALPRGIFAPVIKGLKSLQSMEDKVKAALAGAMTDADGAAARLAANRAHLKHDNQDWITLFPDFASVGTKAAEDFHALAALRIGNHKQAEADRLERIRKEEAERLEKEQLEQQAQAVIDSVATASTGAVDAAYSEAVTTGTGMVKVLPGGGLAHVPAGDMIAPPSDDGATLSLGQINTELAKAGVKIDAAGITLLGFEFKQERGKVLFPKAKFAALCRHIAGKVLELPRRD